MTDTLPCWIYRSPRKDEMYLYLGAEDGFEAVPKPLLERFGKPELVMQIELHDGRILAREDVVRVMRNLAEKGFHLQMAPVLAPSLYHGNEA